MKSLRIAWLYGLLFTGSKLVADCPTPAGPYGWAIESYIQYTFSVGTGGPLPDAFMPLSIPDLGISGDINSGAATWTSNNLSSNYTHTEFAYTTATSPYRFFAYQTNYPGTFSDPGKAAITSLMYYSGTNILAEANTTFYYGSVDPNSGATIIDTGSPNYHTFISKITLHEIGHTMGLADQPYTFPIFCGGQSAGESVMNGWCGDDDSNNIIPTAPTICDNDSVF